MAFKLNCDRCDRFIKNVPAAKVRTLIDSHQEIICKGCQTTEEGLQKFIESLRVKAQREFEILAKRYKDLIKEETARMVSERVLDQEESE